jgi:hypothetical protein
VLVTLLFVVSVPIVHTLWGLFDIPPFYWSVSKRISTLLTFGMIRWICLLTCTWLYLPAYKYLHLPARMSVRMFIRLFICLYNLGYCDFDKFFKRTRCYFHAFWIGK